LASDLYNLISRQPKIVRCLTRIAHKEGDDGLYEPRQAPAILASHDRLTPDKPGYLGGINRVTPVTSEVQQDREVRLLHEAVMSVDAPDLRRDMAHFRALLL